jgi:hypothetical protein
MPVLPLLIALASVDIQSNEHVQVIRTLPNSSRFDFDYFRDFVDYDAEIIKILNGSGQWGATSFSGDEILKEVWSSIQIVSRDRLFARRTSSDPWLLFDRSGRQLASSKGSYSVLSNDRFLLNDGTSWGIYDGEGKLISGGFENARYYENETVAAKRNGKWGFVDFDGKTRVSFQYDNAGPLAFGYAQVHQDGKVAFISESGSLATDFVFTKPQISPFGYAVQAGDFSTMVIDLKTKASSLLPKSDYGSILPVGEGFIRTTKPDRKPAAGESASSPRIKATTGVLKFGKGMIVPNSYRSIGCVKTEAGYRVFCFNKDGKASHDLRDGDGKLLIECVKGLSWNESKVPGLVKIQAQDGGWGYADLNGKTVIPTIYNSGDSSTSDFYNGRVFLKFANGKYGVLDDKGKIIVDGRYLNSSSFELGIAQVKTAAGVGSIDKDGKTVVPMIYEDVNVMRGDRVRIKKGGLYGIADKKGNVLIEPKFKSLMIPGAPDHLFAGETDAGDGLYTMGGETIIAPQYDFIMFYEQKLIAAYQKESDGSGVVLMRVKPRIGRSS